VNVRKNVVKIVSISNIVISILITDLKVISTMRLAIIVAVAFSVVTVEAAVGKYTVFHRKTTGT